MSVNRNRAPFSGVIKICAGLSLIALVSACASHGPGRGGPPGGGVSGGAPMPGAAGLSVKPVGMLFAGMDADHDYAVTTEELNAGIAAEWTGLASFDQPQISPVRIRDWAAIALGSVNALPSHISFDTDFSGSVTEAEFTTRLRTEFNELDKNGDGVLLRAEIVHEGQPQNAQQGPNGGGRGGPPGGGRGDGPPRGGNGGSGQGW